MCANMTVRELGKVTAKQARRGIPICSRYPLPIRSLSDPYAAYRDGLGIEIGTG
jgi:hypothetical protein